MVVLINDLEEIARNNNMFDHELDPTIKKKLDELDDRKEIEHKEFNAIENKMR